MRRILAVALVAGVLLGGCGRQHAQSSGRPAVGGAPAATHGTAPAAGKSTKSGAAESTKPGAGATSADGRPAANATEDVGPLLGDVDKQLSSDSQPAEDSD